MPIDPMQVYDFVQRIQMACGDARSQSKLGGELQEAMLLGSSSLEILGAISFTLAKHLDHIEELLVISPRIL